MLLPMMHLDKEARQRQPPRHRPMGATCWLPLSPSKIPRTLSASTERASRSCRVPPRRPKRRPQARRHQLFSVHQRVGISCCSSQKAWPSASHPQSPSSGSQSYLWRPLLGVPLTQTAWAAALVRVGTCYESPVTETPGLQGCLEDHATGTVQDTGPACSRHDREVAWCRRMIWKGPGTTAPEFYKPPATVHYPDLITTTAQKTGRG